ncbi:MAG: amino acid racemase [Defluviitaleaceae bacterium]|nr:amino acid racemase [Defluviitaleaceae bacterium]MCL2835948.1 amino acid racemase [Defluviitaleaceae bacterium]
MKKNLGILGGMGPQATIDFQLKIFNLTIAARDQDHIRIITDNHPQIPDRVSAITGKGVSPVHAMQKSLNKLISCGAQRIAMPCVSAHFFLPELLVPPTITFLNLPEIVAAACSAQFAGKKAGVLCTTGTAKSGIISSALEKSGTAFIHPNEGDLNLLGKLIMDIKSRADLKEITRQFDVITNELAGWGAEYFLLACTEVPLIVQAYDFPHPYIDCTTELAKAAIKSCGYVYPL